MKRLNPIASLSGLIMTILLLSGLSISLWVNRGLAFSPGPVTAISKSGILLQGFASHSQFEKQCQYCHEPLKTDLATKCMDCHQEVATQIKDNSGVHSKISAVNQCVSCHPEHRGELFDPTAAAFQLFDHSRTRFSLNWHQETYETTPMGCSECHENIDFSVVNAKTCLDCHNQHDNTFEQRHTKEFGIDCLGCHDGVDRMTDFNHSTTGYTLEFSHAQITCAECHKGNSITSTPKECKDCHAEPALHHGIFESSCENCHSPQGWSPATLDGKPFGHLKNTRFSLNLHAVDYQQQEITCVTCHPSDITTADIQTCIACHNTHDQVFLSDHIEKFTSNCLECHDGVDRLSNFDHANFFPLEGKHVSIDCKDCHGDNFYQGTPSECFQCHKEPEIHAGVFGLKCGYCHSSEAWSPAKLENHTFPINHGLEDKTTQLRCEACHSSTYSEYTCYTCHEHQPDEIKAKHSIEKIPVQEIPNCVKCHPLGQETKDRDD